jgi:hypothetical protein
MTKPKNVFTKCKCFFQKGKKKNMPGYSATSLAAATIPIVPMDTVGTVLASDRFPAITFEG